MRLLFFLCLLPYAIGLHAAGLFEPEETRYALSGREMSEGGDWLIPRLEGAPYLEKPPLTTWSVALAFRAFGVSEFSSRLLSLVSAVAIFFFTIRIATRCGGERVGWGAGATLAASPLLFGMGRVLSTDTLFAAAVIAGMDALVSIREKPSAWRHFGLGLACAVATLAKGPLGLLLIGLGGGSLAWVDRSWKPILRFFHPLTLGTTLFLAAPWFLLVQERYSSFWDHFFVYHHWDRFFGANPADRDLHAEPWFYYVPILLGATLPWCLGLFAAWRGVRLGTSAIGDPRPARALWIWAVAMFLFFSLSSGKRIAYLLPVIPPLAVALALHFFSILEVRLARRMALGMSAAFALVAIALPFFEERFSFRPIAAKAREVREEPGRSLVVFPGYYHGVSFYIGKGVPVIGSQKELGFGMSLDPGSGVAFWSDGEFSKKLAVPGALAVLGPRDRIRDRMPRWGSGIRWEVVAETERWILIRN